MSSVTFSTTVGGDGSTVTDDDNATTGLRNGGWRTRFVPALTQEVAVAANAVASATSALASKNSAASSSTAASSSASTAATQATNSANSATASASSATASASSATSAAASATSANNSVAAISTAFSSPTPIGNVVANTGAFTNLSYTGTLTGSTGILNIGSGQLYKDASGNVGIGTSSPGYTLDVRTATGPSSISSTASPGTNYSKLQCSNTGGSFQLGIDNSAGSNFGLGAYSRVVWNDGAYPTVFTTNSTERIRIDSSGKVGINVTPSGATAAKLQVTGGPTNATTLATSYSNAVVAVVPKSTSGYSLAIASGTSDSPQLQVTVNGAASGDLLIQPYGGNVGIGESSPATQLHIASATAKTRIDTTNAPSNNPELQLAAVARQFNIGVGGATFATAALQGAYYIYDNTAANYRMVIDYSGNVGIGTTNPTGKLDVAGTIKTLGYTVATLPTGVVGARAYVTDALAPTFGATVVTGGAITIPVFYNGTNWIVG